MLKSGKGELRQGLRAILWLDPRLVKDFEINALVGQCLTDLLHGCQLVDCLICNDADPLGAHVLEVHAHFPRNAGSEADGRSSHLEGVLLELRVILRGGIAPHSSVWTMPVIMMVAGIGVART